MRLFYTDSFQLICVNDAFIFGSFEFMNINWRSHIMCVNERLLVQS